MEPEEFPDVCDDVVINVDTKDSCNDARLTPSGRQARPELESRRERKRKGPSASVPLAPAPVLPEDLEANGGLVEHEFVHAVYDEIAPHFSHTRYKAWPVVESFLRSLDEGALVADVGCGNGKYLGVNTSCFMLGSDRSRGLIELCREKGFEAMVCDCLALPYRTECFDHVVSIAVVHHLTTPERRRAAIVEMLRVLRVGGTMMVTVWALEQEKRKYDTQDVFVPWNLSHNFMNVSQKEQKPLNEAGNHVYYRYYHLFKEGELQQIVSGLPYIEQVAAAYDKDNWYITLRKVAPSV